MRKQNILSLSAILIVVLALTAQATQEPNTGGMVLVPVMVSDSKEVPISTLKAEHFQILEDNKEQKIAYFSAAGEPMTVNVVLGLSARGPVTTLAQSDRASTEILGAVERSREANAGRPGAVVQSPLDSDGLLGVVSQAISSLANQPGPRKALVVVSDGLTSSGNSNTIPQPTALIDAARLSKFPIHFLFVVKSLPEPALTEASTYATGYYLQQAAEYSGGDMLVGEIENNLTKVSTNLRDALKNQYLLGFNSTNTAKDGKWRKLTVKVTAPAGSPKLKINAKSRYFVPKG